MTSALGDSVFAGSYSDSLYSVTCDVRFPHAVPPEIFTSATIQFDFINVQGEWSVLIEHCPCFIPKAIQVTCNVKFPPALPPEISPQPCTIQLDFMNVHVQVGWSVLICTLPYLKLSCSQRSGKASLYKAIHFSVTCDVRFPHAVPAEISLQPQSNLLIVRCSIGS